MTVDEVQGLLALVKPPLESQIRSSNVVLQCPFAAKSGHKKTVDRTPSLGILPDDQGNGGTWNCFTCHRKGPLTTFFESLTAELSFDTTDAVTQLQAILYQSPEQVAASIPPYEALFASENTEAHAGNIGAVLGKSYRTFPESWLAAYQGKVSQKLLDRGITLDTVRAWGIGHDRREQRIVYPVRDFAGQLVGAVGGAIFKPDRAPKYKNYWHRVHSRCDWPLDHKNGRYYCPSCCVEVQPQFALDGFRKAHHLFGAEWFRNPPIPSPPNPVVVVVEGIVDALRVWQATRGFLDPFGFPVQPVALLGSAVSDQQASLIVELTADRRVIVFLDNDEAGRKGDRGLQEGNQRVRGLSDIFRARLRYFRAVYPEDREGADPGSLTDEEIRQALTQAQLILRGPQSKKSRRSEPLQKT